MDLLIVEPLEAEVLQWLDARHELFYAPRLPQDRSVFMDALSDARGVLVPPHVAIDAQMIGDSPRLRAIGRIAGGVDGLDLSACARAGVEVVRPTDAAAPAEAEFMLGALLALLRPSPEESARVAGRELGTCTVGLVGMSGAARTLAQLLRPLGSRLIGYDPTVHASDAQWSRWGVQPVGLPDLFEQADAVCVQLPYFSRYKGLLGERVLGRCRNGQVLVSISPLDLFDERVLADVLQQRRMTAAWLDCLDPGAQTPGRPLHQARGLIATPRLAAYTRDARIRSAWSVARRLDEILRLQPRGRRAAPAPGGRPGRPVPIEPRASAPMPFHHSVPPTDTAAVESPTQAEILDIRKLLPKASDLDLLRAPVLTQLVTAPELTTSAESPEPIRQAPRPAVEAPEADAQAGPRRRFGETEHSSSTRADD